VDLSGRFEWTAAGFRLGAAADHPARLPGSAVGLLADPRPTAPPGPPSLARSPGGGVQELCGRPQQASAMLTGPPRPSRTGGCMEKLWLTNGRARSAWPRPANGGTRRPRWVGRCRLLRQQDEVYKKPATTCREAKTPHAGSPPMRWRAVTLAASRTLLQETSPDSCPPPVGAVLFPQQSASATARTSPAPGGDAPSRLAMIRTEPGVDLRSLCARR
jgi:hypothetical protein